MIAPHVGLDENMRTESHRLIGGLYRRQRSSRLGWAAAVAAWVLLLPGNGGFYAYATDYLSSEEIEKVRDSQKPHQRMLVLNDIFQRRVDAVIATWGAVEAGDGSAWSRFKRQGQGLEDPALSLSFRESMKEVAMCLEDIETNLDNYPLDLPLSVWHLETGRPVRMNTKKFQKVLKKLRGSLTEFNHWLTSTLVQLEGVESRMAEEVAAFLSDLDEALEKTIELAGGVVQKEAPVKHLARP